MDALDLAFALRGCGVSKGDAIKAEAFPKLGESVFEGGPEEPCIVDINLLREPGAQQGLAKEVNVRQQTLIVVELASDLQTAAIVQHVDERQFGLALPEEIAMPLAIAHARTCPLSTANLNLLIISLAAKA